MANPDVKSPGPNLQPAHPSSSDDESWKTSPSKEIAGDEGHNGRLIREHRQEENSPARKTGAVPEEASTEPATKTLQENTDRATRQLLSQERQAHGPAPKDPLRQPGESSAAPKRRA